LSLPPNTAPLEAVAVEGEVVLLASGPGRAIEASFTPEAVLASLAGMKAAAEEALQQRAAMLAPELQAALDLLPLLGA
jgi:hypothetical protein